MGETLGFAVEVVPPVEVDGERVSSTRIRGLLYEGEVTRAATLLDRHYSIAGRVVGGYRRGRAIGFPTANIETPYEVIPAVGVYAVYVRLEGGGMRAGVANVGYNPTFHRDDFIVEAHLLDFDEDLYGAEVELFFVRRLRGEMTFDGVEELTAQIGDDVAAARRILAVHS
jgi:riboflavin kinase/FMN adenylyltransferase